MATRQGLARGEGGGVIEPGHLAEGDHPGIIHGQEIENRGKEGRILRPGPQIGFARTRRPKKNRQEVVVARQPPKRLEADRLGKIPLHLQRPFLGWKLFVKTHVGRFNEFNIVEQIIKQVVCIMPGRILIADPTATNRIILKVRLGAARYETLQASSGTEALDEARAQRPDLVIASSRLGDPSTADLCTRLKSDPLTRAIPILIIGTDADRNDRLAALRAGADDFLTKPVDEMTLLAIVRQLMRTRATFDEFARRRETNAALGFAEPSTGFDRPARVAVIAPTPQESLGWRRSLGKDTSFRVSTLTRSDALDTMIAADAPDAFVIAADLHGPGDGLRLVSELRSHQATRNAVILIQNEASTVETVPLALDLGASAVVPGHFDSEETTARLEALIARKREIDALRDTVDRQLGLAVRDPLTGLFNRRYAEAYLTRIADEAARTGQPFAVMMLDLDRFKTVNDTFGHTVGDEVLIETAQRLTENLREIDLVARHGGEEFLVAMPETDIAAARTAAERLRRVIAERPMRSQSRAIEVPVTVSIGVSVCYGHEIATEMSVLIDQADTALYASKSEGRNLVTLAEGSAA